VRLWSLHPRYLDARGLVALWREALLAQAVLGGRTRGYTRHPQLLRFRSSPSPGRYIAAYLVAVHAEASARGYGFDASKIGECETCLPLPVSAGQLEWEWMRLRERLALRSPHWLRQLPRVSLPAPHPLFRVVPGDVAEWEVAAHRR